MACMWVNVIRNPLQGVRAHPGTWISIQSRSKGLDLFLYRGSREGLWRIGTGFIQDTGYDLPGTLTLRSSVNKGEMRKCLILVNSTEERSKTRKERARRRFLGSGLSLPYLSNAAAPLLLLISPTGGRNLSTSCSPRKAYSRPYCCL